MEVGCSAGPSSARFSRSSSTGSRKRWRTWNPLRRDSRRKWRRRASGSWSLQMWRRSKNWRNTIGTTRSGRSMCAKMARREFSILVSGKAPWRHEKTMMTVDPGVSGFPFVMAEREGKRALILRDAQHEYMFLESPEKQARSTGLQTDAATGEQSRAAGLDSLKKTASPQKLRAQDR